MNEIKQRENIRSFKNISVSPKAVKCGIETVSRFKLKNIEIIAK